MSFLKHAIVLLFFTLCTGRRIIRSNGDDVDLTPKLQGRVAESCKTKNNQDGICVHETYCNEDHTILPGGVIEDFELRSKECKPFEWCCTNATMPPTIETIDNDCTPVDENLSCPWCVSLHKSVDTKISTTGLFCMGSLIGTKVILTAATCIKAAQKHMLWARIPGSADPNRNYTVRYRQFHQHYNTGSHEYDFGILVLENDVDWGKGKWKGACLGLRSPPHGECVGFGFDADGAITPTLLTVKKGGCQGAGDTSDAACGTKFEDYCIVSTGGPVLCSAGAKVSVVTGVARSACFSDTILLGDLSLSNNWLTEELNKMNVLPKHYEMNTKSNTLFTLREN